MCIMQGCHYDDCTLPGSLNLVCTPKDIFGYTTTTQLLYDSGVAALQWLELMLSVLLKQC